MKPIRYSLRVLSQLLSYPDAGVRQQWPQLMTVLDEEAVLSSARRTELQALVAHLQHLNPMDAEARYVETFDRGRATCLHLFEHVHGDSREQVVRRDVVFCFHFNLRSRPGWLGSDLLLALA